MTTSYHDLMPIALQFYQKASRYQRRLPRHYTIPLRLSRVHPQSQDFRLEEKETTTRDTIRLIFPSGSSRIRQVFCASLDRRCSSRAFLRGRCSNSSSNYQSLHRLVPDHMSPHSPFCPDHRRHRAVLHTCPSQDCITNTTIALPPRHVETELRSTWQIISYLVLRQDSR